MNIIFSGRSLSCSFCDTPGTHTNVVEGGEYVSSARMLSFDSPVSVYSSKAWAPTPALGGVLPGDSGHCFFLLLYLQGYNSGSSGKMVSTQAAYGLVFFFLARPLMFV